VKLHQYFTLLVFCVDKKSTQ